MSSKRYTEEFKIEAVKQVTDRGHSVADVAGRLECRSTACARGGSSSAGPGQRRRLRRARQKRCAGLSRSFAGSPRSATS